jgi:DNA invertase Pin-like site-specific DNA recombinase
MKDAAKKGIMQRAADMRKPRAIESFARGERITSSKLTSEQVKEIRRFRNMSPAIAVASLFQISVANVYRIWNNEMWKHVI